MEWYLMNSTADAEPYELTNYDERTAEEEKR